MADKVTHVVRRQSSSMHCYALNETNDLHQCYRQLWQGLDWRRGKCNVLSTLSDLYVRNIPLKKAEAARMLLLKCLTGGYKALWTLHPAPVWHLIGAFSSLPVIFRKWQHSLARPLKWWLAACVWGEKSQSFFSVFVLIITWYLFRECKCDTRGTLNTSSYKLTLYQTCSK